MNGREAAQNNLQQHLRAGMNLAENLRLVINQANNCRSNAVTKE
jgi:hypothetical protein